VIAGIVTGTATTIVWYLVPALKSRMYELVPAFLLTLVATVVVSLVTRPPAEVEALHAAMEPAGRR
jgi:Na+/proline symporter